MAFTTETWVLHKDLNKATITFEMNNFAAAVAAKEKGQSVESRPCSIGGSKFRVRVYPSGANKAAEDMVSVYTMNDSDHKVAIDYSMTVGDVKQSLSNQQLEGKSSWGWHDFMERKEVGANLTVVADITLLREQVGGADEGVKEVNTDLADTIGELKNDVKKMKIAQAENMEELKIEIKEIKEIKQQKTRGAIKIAECVICLEELRPPLRIVQCLKGHKLCEPCSLKKEVVSCPLNCRSGFMGRDLGMEAFVRQLLGE